MFDPEYNPYERLEDIELALTYNAQALGNQQTLVNSLLDMNKRNNRMIKEMARALEKLYNYTQILDEEIKELREQQTAGRELRK